MRFHPATLMLAVWAGGFLAFLILPFELTYREIEFEGLIMLAIFLGAFCLGAYMNALPMAQKFPQTPLVLNFTNTDKVLKIVGAIACAAFIFELIRRGNFGLDLREAYLARSERAQALLQGRLSSSSILFKIGFLTYPASYVYTARQLIFERKPNLILLFLFGLLPGVLAAWAMGGRAPLFNTIVLAVISFRMRKLFSTGPARQDFLSIKKIPVWARVVAVILAIFAFNYFINVFVARAEGVGGPEEMLRLVATVWGVTFSGPYADFMINTLGPATTYLIFVFIWYLVQGIVMSNSLFVNYDGGALWGVYGIDIFSALMRRIDGDGVAAKFEYLLNLDTYGFLPSAYGTLFVDYSYGGIVVAAIWGWLAALVYRKVKSGVDPRWKIFVPFVVFGIIFSLVNTPIGYSNGFVTHMWLVIAFFLIKTNGAMRARRI